FGPEGLRMRMRHGYLRAVLLPAEYSAADEPDQTAPASRAIAAPVAACPRRRRARSCVTRLRGNAARLAGANASTVHDMLPEAEVPPRRTSSARTARRQAGSRWSGFASRPLSGASC